jgi:dipeptidyl-peptidase-4
MMKIKLLFLLMTATLSMSAQDKLFTLEDLNFGGNNYRNMQPENKWYAWWGDQLIRTDVEECYLVDKKTGKEKVLFTLNDINKWTKGSDTKQVRHLHSATFPYADKSIVAVNNGQATLHIDFKKHQVVWLDSISKKQANDWNKVSKATAYVDNYQLYVVDGDGKKHQLSTDGSREIVYGQSVHRNEFGINKGTFWSPNGQRLAFYRMDQSMVTDYPQVDIFPREATYEPDKYPMAGMTSHVVTVGVYDLNTNKTVYLKTPKGSVCGDSVETSTPVYFTNISWSPDGKTIYMFELNRDQNDCRLVSYDATTGKRIAELYRETSKKYVEPMHPIVFLPWDDTKFIMQSQRDGYNHLYLYNNKGELLSQLTKGQWVVEDMVGFNKKDKSIIIVSNEANPIQRNIYSVSTQTGKRTLLDNGRGSHRAELSESGLYLVDRYTEPDVPRNIDVASTQTKKATRLLTAKDPWEGYQQPIFESGSIKAADGKTDLYYRMVKPHDFDATKKYPTVVYVYGGPHAHNVEAAWHWYSRTWETYMAQKGYVLFILDNRGSENRGLEFEQATFRQLGQVEMQDQMKGVEYLKSLPYVDADKLGVHGWSFGGFMTISLMLNYPDVFKVAVAGGPVIDWKWYEVMYGERYMDTPQQNPEGYAKASLIDKAKNLKGKLQIITGYNDNTVVPQHCLSFLNACIKAGTQPDFFAYPGEEHNMRGHASVHLHERITQYFEDYLK